MCVCVCVCGCVLKVEAMTFPPSSGKSFILGPDEDLQSELGLGELAGLTVANEAESLTYDVSTRAVTTASAMTTRHSNLAVTATASFFSTRLYGMRLCLHIGSAPSCTELPHFTQIRSQRCWE